MERNSFASRSAVMADLFKITSIAADTASPVLITGSGKTENELFARMLHFDGVRCEKPFVHLECSGDCDLQTCVQNAGAGTLFIDGIELLSAGEQTSLLELIRNKTEETARIVAASSQNLEALVMQEKFNADLLSLLSGVVLRVPALFDRLRNRPLFDENGQMPSVPVFAGSELVPLKEAETVFRKNYVQKVLGFTAFNQTKAAEILGIQRTYLSRILAELGIRR